eukprot:TRINITY_DN4590_c0_g1_i1.p1 TRINITY_DN4590_c0_g1~~TRINITY_DN4590_c0_g1_i1.p1  ORF type:complete len:489 (+),score=136.98 TRINITY_DN4590_c0_g1_i1:166-1467(+)
MDGNYELNEPLFLDLMEKVIGETKYLQNNPPEFIPEEDRVGDHVLKVLMPYSTENGGPLKIERINYVPKRNNIIITYPGTTDKYVSFVGSHMDVVTANPSEWTRDPFKLTREGDNLYGRGTTDCLGHVVLLTDLFIQLAQKKPKLAVNVAAVFIANEENSEIEGIGVDALVKDGKMEAMKTGPLYWCDSADSHPCIGTGGVQVWRLTAYGKPGHSGMPQNVINPIFVCKQAMDYVLGKFHAEFGPHANESTYGYASPSTMKPTSWSSPAGASNIIPVEATMQGDIRLTPFYSLEDAKGAIERYVKEFNEKLHNISEYSPAFKNALPDGARARVELTWVGDCYHGFAADLKSFGFQAIDQATKEVLGSSKPFSVTGSLPLVSDLQKAGFDVQMIGYGVEEVYHAPNEFCTISGMKNGFKIIVKVIDAMDAAARK